MTVTLDDLALADAIRRIAERTATLALPTFPTQDKVDRYLRTVVARVPNFPTTIRDLLFEHVSVYGEAVAAVDTVRLRAYYDEGVYMFCASAVAKAVAFFELGPVSPPVFNARVEALADLLTAS